MTTRDKIQARRAKAEADLNHYDNRTDERIPYASRAKFVEHCRWLLTQLDFLLAENERLEKALNKLVNSMGHDSQCRYITVTEGFHACTCGSWARQAEARGHAVKALAALKEEVG